MDRQNQNAGKKQQKEFKVWDRDFPKNQITEGIDTETINYAKEFGKYLATDYGKLKTTQLRKFFAEVKRIQMIGYNDAKSDFILLQPKLAYAVGRLKKDSPKIEDFYKVMAEAINLVHNEDQFGHFIEFFEAVVAFHKYYEKQ